MNEEVAYKKIMWCTNKAAVTDLGRYLNELINEFIHSLTRNPVRATASCLAERAKTSPGELVLERKKFCFLLESSLDIPPR
jgi:hypothetical protein